MNVWTEVLVELSKAGELNIRTVPGNDEGDVTCGETARGNNGLKMRPDAIHPR